MKLVACSCMRMALLETGCQTSFMGVHVRPDLKVGQIATNTHTLFAGTCEVKIRFKGKGGHAAFPHEANDALVAASYFVTQVQSVVSRNVNPIEGAVVTFGLFQPEQPTMSSQHSLFTWNYSGLDSGHESLGTKAGQNSCRRSCSCLRYGSRSGNSNKVVTCLLRTIQPWRVN